MTQEEMLEKVYNTLLNDDDGDYAKIGIFGEYSEFIKSRASKEELSTFIYYARDKDDLSYFCFDNPYDNMSDDCKEFIDRYYELIEECKKD